MDKKSLITALCLFSAAVTIQAEQITLKPNWTKGDKKVYYVEEIMDTLKTVSSDMIIEVLDDKGNYKMSCTYTNRQYPTMLVALAKLMLGAETFKKIEDFAPKYTVNTEGLITSVDNFKEYQEILPPKKDTTDGLLGDLSRIMLDIQKHIVVADEKSFLENKLKEVLAIHKYFGKTYDTKKNSMGTLNITSCTINYGDAKSVIKATKKKGRITINATAKQNEMECINAVTEWMKKYMENVEKETGTPIDPKKMKKETDSAIKEIKEKKFSAEIEETVEFDVKTGWLISFKSVQTIKSAEGDMTETLIVKAKK